MIDVRTDTVTKPTQKMLDAMYRAEVGDEILGEDPTVKELESLAAAMFQKEAALFTVSGTMSNQLAVMALTQRGDEVIVGDRSHIYHHEAGALAALSQVQARTVECQEGIPDPARFQQAIRTADLQSARTGLICLENTYDLNRGYPVSAEQMAAVAALGKEYGVPTYLDGARIFNAAFALDTTADRLAAPVDALQICLTKGLCAPFGSLLLGDGAFVEKARWLRQRIGGGMRQAGYMAATGIVALKEMTEQTLLDNQNAKALAHRIAKRHPLLLDPDTVRSNIINLDAAHAGVDPEAFLQGMQEHGVLIKAVDLGHFRMVCHYGIDEPELDQIEAAVTKAILRLKGTE